MEREERSDNHTPRNFAFLLVVVFFTTFANSMVAVSPVPFLVKNLAATKEAFTVFIGVLASVSSVAVITGNVIGGFLADKAGRKNAIVLGSGMLLFSLFGYTVAPNVFWVIGVYFVQMFSMSLFQPAFTALVADMSKLTSRGKAFGHFNLLMIGGYVPAPFVGGLIADSFGLYFSFIIAAIVSLVGLVACFGLTDISSGTSSSSEVSAGEKEEKTLMPFGTVLLIFGAIGLLSGVATGLLMPLNRLYPIDVLHVNATELGLVFSLGSGLMTALVQVPGGRLADRFGRKPLVLLSLLGAPFVVALAYTSSLTEFILASAGVFALGNIGAPAYSAWQMELVPCSKRAFASGLINALTGIGMFFGPFISIWLYQSQPSVAVAFVAAALPWIIQIPPILKLRETKIVTVLS